jgi:hypothetical protein
MSATPAMTKQKAKKRAVMAAAPDPIGSWEDNDAAEDGAEVDGDRGDRDDLDALADLEAAGRCVERDHSGDHGGQRPRAHQPEAAPAAPG